MKGNSIQKTRPKDRVSSLAILVSLAILINPFSTLNIGGFGIFVFVFVPLVISFLLLVYKRPNKLRWNSPMKALMVLFGYSFLAFLWSPNFQITDLLQITVLILSIGLYKFNEREQKLIGFSAVAALVFTCYLVYVSSISIQLDGRASITVFGVERDPNYVSLIFIPGFAILLKILFSEGRIIIRTIALLMFLLTVFTEMRMGSRGGTLTCLFVLILSFFFYRKVSIGSLIVGISVIGLLFYYLFPVFMDMLPDVVSHRFTAEALGNDEYGGRWEIWSAITKKMFDSSIFYVLFGFGTRSTVAIIGMAAHNFLLQYFFEGGIVGLILLIVFIVLFMKNTYKTKDHLPLIIFAGSFFSALGLAISGIVDFWINIAIAFALIKSTDIQTNTYLENSNS